MFIRIIPVRGRKVPAILLLLTSGLCCCGECPECRFDDATTTMSGRTALRTLVLNGGTPAGTSREMNDRMLALVLLVAQQWQFQRILITRLNQTSTPVFGQ